METMKQILKLKQVVVDTEIMPLEYVKSSHSVATFLQEEIGADTQESLVLLCLNTKNKVTHYSIVSTGTVNQSIANPRDIFQRALLSNASRIVVAHNHPSGSVESSRQDNLFTAKLKECGEMLGIPLLDHIIVTENDYYSYAEYGQI